MSRSSTKVSELHVTFNSPGVKVKYPSIRIKSKSQESEMEFSFKECFGDLIVGGFEMFLNF